MIILVDDEPDIVNVFGKVLQREGYQVREFTDPLKALDFFTANPKKCSLAITDLRMPYMNGIEFASQVRRISSDVKLLLITAHETESYNDQITHLYLSLLRNVQKEVLLIFPTTNAVRREEGVGIFAELQHASQRCVTVRILTPIDDFVSPQLDELRTAGIVVRQIESPAETKFKLLIVDRRLSIVIETKDDSRGTFERAIGLATFSNSKPTVLPYVTIFESFWRETDLYEKAREADRLKDEFVNIAAHELRNPISPIIGSADFAMEDIRKLKEGKGDDVTLDSLEENIQIIERNATKLYKLSEDILQVSRIESGPSVYV